jgi:hypothetical protein
MITKPAAVVVTPAHWRRPRRNPKNRSASTARKTSPPAKTAWTLERGASESAPMCRLQATNETIHPTRNHLERKQVSGATQRVAHTDRSRENRAAVLEQETGVGAQRRPERKEQPEDHRLGLLPPDEASRRASSAACTAG